MRVKTEAARNLLRQCTARISTGTDRGTGFWVGPGTLLTCSHVVTDSEHHLRDDVVVEWMQDGHFTPYPASAVLATAVEVDLALLTLTVPPPIHPCAFLSPLVSTRDQLTSYGYPSLYPDGDQATFDGEGSSVQAGYPLLKVKDGQVDFGASGSPVLNDRLRSVCSVLTLSRDVNSALGGRATPIEVAFNEWPKLRELQAAALTQDRGWRELTPLGACFDIQTEEQEGLFRGELGQRQSNVPLPLTTYYDSFVRHEPWHKWVESIFGSLSRAREEMIQWFPEIPEIASPSYSANYDLIVASVRQTVAGPLPTSVVSKQTDLEARKQSLFQQRNRTGPTQAISAELESIALQLKATWDLRNLLDEIAYRTEQPRFGKCLLILGDVGSGKTHFLASLLTKEIDHPDRGTFVLLIRPRSLANARLEDFLLSSICKRTDVDWDSLEEFDHYLSSFECPPRLIVAIDDFHTMSDGTGFLDQVKSCVSRYTQLHSLSWVMAIEHQRYLQIVGENAFWDAYGYEPSGGGSSTDPSATARLGPWIQLDDLNWQTRAGIRILQEVARTSKDRGSSLLPKLGHLDEETLRYVSKPFIAWVLFECSDKMSAASLVNLNFLEFVASFWDTLLPRIGEDERWQQRLKTCVGLITTYLVEHGDFSPGEAELAEFVIAKAKGKSDLSEPGNTPSAIGKLERGGLLRGFDAPDPELDVIRKIELTFDVFWNWKLGQRLVTEYERAKKGNSLEFLERWFRKNAGYSAEGRGILEFFLLSIPQVDNAKIWRGAAESARVPAGAVWFAASKVRPPDRDELAILLLRPLPRLRDQLWDLFGFIYFLASLSTSLPDGINTAELFRLLKPYYAALNAASLSDYFVYAVERCVSKITSLQELVETMVELSGCEVMGIADPVAQISIDALKRLEDNPGKRVATIIDYLRRVPPFSVDGKEHTEDRFYYSDWIIYIFCSDLIDHGGIEAYNDLVGARWYRAREFGIRPSLARRMNKEANFAFGDWYRASFPAPLNEYAALVYRAARSNIPAEREAAFFMIRHTRATHKGNFVVVDPHFRPILARILADPELGWIVAKYRDFFRANGLG